MSEINQKISSNVDNLERLNKKYPWVPGRYNIRPLERIKTKKLEYFEEIREVYSSDLDYIFDEIFEFKMEKNKDGKLQVVKEDKKKKKKVLRRNEFPYMLPKGTNHYVMWYSYCRYAEDKESLAITDEEITKDIKVELKKHLGNEKFEFCWYENPKKTITDLQKHFHVQVFWHDV